MWKPLYFGEETGMKGKKINTDENFAGRLLQGKTGIFFPALLMALLCFLPFLVRDGGFFVYFGDYNVQQIPFYMKVHEAVRNGSFFWDMKTDLGSSIYTSYSFYLLGSPFFWLTVPFPKEVVPYLMPYLMMLKIALASLGAYLYTGQFTEDKRSACIGGLLYGFCGYMLVSLVFFHFGEVVAFFPFYLLAADRLAEKKKYGYFALLTAVMAVTNYFFFVGEVIFVTVYIIVRYVADAQYDKKEKLHCVGRFAAEGVSGTLMACFFLLPSLLAVAGNRRVSQTIFDRNLFVYQDVKTYFAILKSMILPPDIISGGTLFGTKEGQVASLSLYLPLFAVSGVIAYLIQKKGWDFRKKLCAVCLVFALVPALNSLFVAGNAVYYARWFFMPLLIMASMTASAVEDFDGKSFSMGSVFYGVLLMVFLLIGVITRSALVEADGFFQIQNRSLYELELVAGIGSFVILAYLVWILKKDKKKKYLNVFLAATVVCCVGTGYLHIHMGYTQVTDHGRKSYKEQIFTEMAKIRPQEDKFYRVETDQSNHNAMMCQNVPSVSCFLSTVSGSIMDFYDFAGITRDVASEIPYDRPGIRSLLSVRFFLQNEISSDDYGFVNQDLLTGYEKTGEENGYGIYENKNYLHMGTVFTSCMKRSEYEKLSEKQKDLVLVYTLVAENDVTEKIIEETGATELLAAQVPKISAKEFAAQCEQQNKSAANRFTYDDTYLTFDYTDTDGGIAFFSVPYSSGFSACVDGKNTEIFKAYGGLMAVCIPQGTHTVTLTYREPGLLPGVIGSISGIVLFALWMVACGNRKKG